MSQANDSARSLRTLATNSSVLSKAILEVAADCLDKIQAENDKLSERDRFLDALEAAGVDNWEGYDEATEIFDNPQNKPV